MIWVAEEGGAFIEVYLYIGSLYHYGLFRLADHGMY
jgi:hypothetical protein